MKQAFELFRICIYYKIVDGNNSLDVLGEAVQNCCICKKLTVHSVPKKGAARNTFNKREGVATIRRIDIWRNTR